VIGELGFSALIDRDDTTVLYDTGQNVSVLHNADAMGVDLSRVQKVVLSHGHFDHTGGLRGVLQRIRKPLQVVSHPALWENKYNRKEGQPDRYIGIPFQRAELESLGAVLTMSREPVELAADFITTGEVPETNAFEHIGPEFLAGGQGPLKHDDFPDDLSIVIKTKNGLVVVLGCAHRGLINTLQHARKLTGVERIRLVLGGSHLTGANEERVWMTVTALKEMNVEQIGLCHCTSLPVAAILASEFQDRFFFNSAGSRVKID
jgi:7,8-dihydropterin-6-yl-methyl-4-(beta-D-ribofuranosyl)aminobenzene 5'-phosphate synthase